MRHGGARATLPGDSAPDPEGATVAAAARHVDSVDDPIRSDRTHHRAPVTPAVQADPS
jgi:hypothetical protein